MQREIKFRAWNAFKKRMAKVEYIQFAKNGNIKWVVWNSVAHSVRTGECVLMQYTGIQDANGQDIYEHDYLHAPTSKLVLEVKWLDGAFCLVPIHTHSKEIAKRWGFQQDKLKVLPIHTMMCASTEGIANMEVIGNRFENPELLAGQGEGNSK
jgi:uncharacterized phage protein (TIGR01671 family)